MRFLTPLLLAIFVVGCTTVPETPRERYAAAEVAYQAVIQTTINLVEQGIIKSGTEEAQMISNSIMATRLALDTWSIFLDDTNRMKTGLKSLKNLQAIISQFTGGD